MILIKFILIYYICILVLIKSESNILEEKLCGRWETKEKMNIRPETSLNVKTPVSGCQWLGYNRIHIRESRTYSRDPNNKIEFMRYEYNSTSGCELENFSRQIIGYGNWELESVKKNNETNLFLSINWRKIIIRSRINNINILEDIKQINWLYKSLDPLYFFDLNLINMCIENLTIIPEYDTNDIVTESIVVNGEKIQLSNERMNIEHLPESKVQEALLRMVTGYSGNVISDMIKKEKDLESQWSDFFKHTSSRMKKICKWKDIREFCLIPPSQIIHKNSCLLPSVDHILSKDYNTLKVSLYPFNSTLPDTDIIEFFKYRDL